jgi:hypothetical protein
MGRFRIICSECGSDKILEKSSQTVLSSEGNSYIYGEGIQRKCIECSNESFVIFKTWKQTDKI